MEFELSTQLSPAVCRLAALALACSLAATADSQPGTVLREQKYSATEGGFGGALDPFDHFGYSVDDLGDLDGDGVSELIVGASEDDDGGNNHGAVWILFLNADGTVRTEQKISSTAGGFGGLLHADDQFGTSVLRLGDLDGDGVTEVAVSAERDDDGGPLRGAVWILFLNTDGTVRVEQKISATAGGFHGPLRDGAVFGDALAHLGDMDGDGAPELAVGSSYDDEGGIQQGSLWILSLNDDGTVRSERKIAENIGGFTGKLRPGDHFGWSVCPLGDLDGDGVLDIAVGANNDDDGGFSISADRGAVWILFLASDGTVRSQRKISDTAGGFLGHLDDVDHFGTAVAGLDDLNGDGVRDLAVGAYGDDDSDASGSDRGAVWVLFLAADGTVRAEQKISDTAGGFGGGLDDLDHFGVALASLADQDGDGIRELLVGAWNDDDGGASAGAVWMLYVEGRLRLDFEREDDFATPLANGQDVSTPPEFGVLVAIAGAGPNAGAALFDSTPGGPNDPSQDRDLLVGSGNLLMLQTDANPTQTVPGLFDRPNDDEDGGVLTLLFTAALAPVSLDLVDIDSGADEACTLALTDAHGKVRIFMLPPGWTGDLLADGIGRRTLDLASLAPQPGFASVATAIEDAGFAPAAVVSLVLQLGSSGALDNFVWAPKPVEFHGPPPARPAARLPTGGSSMLGPP